MGDEKKVPIDNIETQAWEFTESQHPSPSPIRKLHDFKDIPEEPAPLHRQNALEAGDEEHADTDTDESREESSVETDEEVQPIAIHDDEILEIEESSEETVLSPKKELKPPAIAPEAVIEEVCEIEDEPRSEQPAHLDLEDSQQLFESQVFDEVQVLADSDEENAKPSSGVFKVGCKCNGHINK